MGCAEDTEYMVRHLVRGGTISVVPLLLMTYLLPHAHKIYRGQNTYASGMIEQYKCAIAERWGEDIARRFIESTRADQLARNNATKAQWKNAAEGFLPVPRTAPCLRHFPCDLRGSICQGRDPEPL
jgi:hypothetical protein